MSTLLNVSTAFFLIPNPITKGTNFDRLAINNVRIEVLTTELMIPSWIGSQQTPCISCVFYGFVLHVRLSVSFRKCRTVISPIRSDPCISMLFYRHYKLFRP